MVEGEPGRWNPITETLLAYAARADHVARTIGPALTDGKWVISDRFSDSTYAYQGAGRGVERETIRRIDSAVLDDFAPDLTLILDLDVRTGLARAHARRARKTASRNSALNSMKSCATLFWISPGAIPIAARVIDASGTEDEVAVQIFAAVGARFDL